mgnify:CR=1 FL=1
MNGAVVLESGADLVHVEAYEVSDLDVGNLSLSLHLAEPTQRRPTVFVEEDLKEAFAPD